MLATHGGEAHCALQALVHYRHAQGAVEYFRINSRTRHTFVPITKRAPAPPRV